MSTEPNKIIYSMMGVSKYYDKKPVLKDINLSYFYGAKIGVLGLNGSGKSTLLKIMAGVDKEFNGETILSKGYTIGYLEQEPLVDVDLTVRQFGHATLVLVCAEQRPAELVRIFACRVGELVHEDGRPMLLRTREIFGDPNEGPAKITGIQRLLGRRPILAAGNSAGV